MSNACSNITLKTDCTLDEQNQEKCYACQRLLYDTKCASVDLTTKCATDTPSSIDTETCYVCQNFKLQDTIANDSLANSFAENADYIDSDFRYWNEISKTVYLSIGIVGILTCSYYIR